MYLGNEEVSERMCVGGLCAWHERDGREVAARTGCIIKPLTRSVNSRVVFSTGLQVNGASEWRSWKCLWTHGHRHGFSQAGGLVNTEFGRQFISLKKQPIIQLSFLLGTSGQRRGF